MSESGHVADLVTLQPEAIKRLLTSFYDTGVADDSLFLITLIDSKKFY